MYFLTLLVKRHFCLTTPVPNGELQYKYCSSPLDTGLGFSRFARRYSGNVILIGHCFLFLLVLRCFTSQGALHHHLRMLVIEVYSIGFPHSEISGSKGKGPSPKRIAAFRVLHRHVEPRHPPYALTFLLGNLEIILYSVVLHVRPLGLHNGICLSHLQC